MKVYIIFNDFLEGIELVFKNYKDAEKTLKSLKNSRDYQYHDLSIQEHDVIE